MINNRQGGRRGRGRNGPRPQGGAPRPEQGNRIDNRSRGNANQLYEKYKTLARDAQTAGDRVMTEYYLQFADHYFRVLSETRARFEEQRPRRDDQNRADFGDDYDNDDGEADGDGEERADRFDDQPRAERNPRREQRETREAREPREDEEGDQRQFQPRGERREREEREPREARESNGQRFERPRRPRRDPQPEAAAGDQPERIDAGVLPPAIGADPAPAEQPAAGAEVIEVAEEAPRRRRTRRPRQEPATDAPSEAAA